MEQKFHQITAFALAEIMENRKMLHPSYQTFHTHFSSLKNSFNSLYYFTFFNVKSR